MRTNHPQHQQLQQEQRRLLLAGCCDDDSRGCSHDDDNVKVEEDEGLRIRRRRRRRRRHLRMRRSSFASISSPLSAAGFGCCYSCCLAATAAAALLVGPSSIPAPLSFLALSMMTTAAVVDATTITTATEQATRFRPYLQQHRVPASSRRVRYYGGDDGDDEDSSGSRRRHPISKFWFSTATTAADELSRDYDDDANDDDNNGGRRRIRSSSEPADPAGSAGPTDPAGRAGGPTDPAGPAEPAPSPPLGPPGSPGPARIRSINSGRRRKRRLEFHEVATASSTARARRSDRREEVEGGGDTASSFEEPVVRVVDRFAHVHADASREHPDEVFRELRRRTERSTSRTRTTTTAAGSGLSSARQGDEEDDEEVEEAAAAASTQERNEPSDWFRWLGRRRTAEEATAAAPASSSVGDSSTTRPNENGPTTADVDGDGEEDALLSEGFVNADLGDGDVVSNETDFNVTAKTDYNVSLVVDRGEGGEVTAVNDTSTVVYTESERTKNSTSFAGGESGGDRFRPIRIRAFLSEIDGGGQYLTDEEHEILLQDLVRPALLSWSAALRVDPVVGNLTVDPAQLVDGASCGPGRDTGLPSAPVPSAHLSDGVNSTDLILYLNLGFVNANRTVPTSSEGNNGTTNDDSETSLSDIFRNGFDLSGLNNETDDDAVPAAPPSDFVNGTALLTNHTRGEPQPCSGSYLAASSFCNTDQFDRPTAAILHICIGDDFFRNESLQRNIMTIRHELGVRGVGCVVSSGSM